MHFIVCRSSARAYTWTGEMAEVLFISVPSSTEHKDGHTNYLTLCRFGELEWSVLKRYSQFLDLKTRMENEAIRVGAPFPKKGFGVMGASALQKRREMLDAYVKDLSGSFLPEHLFDFLCDFVELKAQAAKATSGGAGSKSQGKAAAPAAVPSAADSAPVKVSVVKADEPAPVAPGSNKWDPSFLSSDPFASLLAPDSPPSAPTAPAPVAAPVPKKVAPPPAAAPSAPLPGFFASSAKSYSPDGEGLRDAIKAVTLLVVAYGHW